MIEKGNKITIYDGETKIVFDIHPNGNPIIKNKGNLCQVPLSKCRKV